MESKQDRNALKSLGSLIKLLPTGTIFMFQFLSPVLSNNGQCHVVNKYLMGTLLIICGLNCALATFTDSHKDEKGNTRYGVVTMKGTRSSSSKTSNHDSNIERGMDNVKSKYMVRVGDFVHAFMGLLVFCVVAVLDYNTLDCFVPRWESCRGVMLMVLPPIVGGVCSVVFALFPSNRNGIGYPSYKL